MKVLNYFAHLFNLKSKDLSPKNQTGHTIDPAIPNQQVEKVDFNQLEDLLNLHKLLPNLKKLPRTRGWAASPDFLLCLAETILECPPKLILEAGSGTSTVVIAAAIKQNQLGRLISLDHQPPYAQQTQSQLQSNKLSAQTQLLCAPLKTYKLKETKLAWYDFDGADFSEKIDLIIIDGPPRLTGPLARYPAIPLLISHLKDKATIILDDANREDEQQTISKWESFLKENHYTSSTKIDSSYEKGIAIMKIEKNKPGP